MAKQNCHTIVQVNHMMLRNSKVWRSVTNAANTVLCDFSSGRSIELRNTYCSVIPLSLSNIQDEDLPIRMKTEIEGFDSMSWL
jgi:hypothetical protein